MTGFRFAYGGAQEYYGVTPDLCTLGKIIGGGFPLAAIAGREDIMALFDRGAVGDDRFLTQIGTLSGNPVAAAAGLATLAVLRRPGTYERVFATGRALMAGMRRHPEGLRPARAGGRRAGAVRRGLRRRRRRTTIAACCAPTWSAPRRVNRTLRAHGVLKGESKYYVSLAHDERDVADTLAAFAAAIAAEAR